MDALTIADFAPLEGQVIDVDAGGARHQFRLVEVQELPNSVRTGGAFRLEFVGPSQPVLPQATYGFDLPGKRCDIFIVAIGADADGTRYEAIFF